MSEMGGYSRHITTVYRDATNLPLRPLVDELYGVGNAVLASNLLTKRISLLAKRRIRCDLSDSSTQSLDIESLLWNRYRSNSQSVDSSSPERLVTEKRADDCRTSGTEPSRRSTATTLMHDCCDPRKEPIVRGGINGKNCAWQFKPCGIEASPATRNNRTHTCGLNRIQDNLSETNWITTEDAAEAKIDRRFTACEKTLKRLWWSPVF